MPLLAGFFVGGILFCPKMLLVLVPVILVGMVVSQE